MSSANQKACLPVRREFLVPRQKVMSSIEVRSLDSVVSLLIETGKASSTHELWYLLV